MRIETKKVNLLKDFVINIIAVAIPIALLQLIIFPQLAKIEGEEAYGFVVTVVSIMTLFSDSWGNILNNVRLLQDDKYEEKGDFNIILLAGVVFNLLTVYGGYCYYGTGNDGVLGVLVASVCILLRAYYIVAFRLELSYTNILINNLIMVVGYLIGFVVFLKAGDWAIIYSIGNFLALIHLRVKSTLITEPLKKTKLFWRTFKKFLILYIADFLRTFITYADKLLIFPILGAKAVAYYYAASVMGKMISMVISPISSVILSYIVKTKSFSQQMINKILLLLLIVSGVGVVLAYLVGRVLLKLLYPAWFDVSVELLPWTVLSAILGGVISVIHPFILKFKSEKYQIIVNVIHIIMYVVVVLLFTKVYGLPGFCVGYCVTMTIKLFVELILLKSIGKERSAK